MAVLTGTSGELRFRGVRVGKCREFSLDISRDALETTVLGQWDRTFVEGIRGASGSTTVLYDRDDTATRDLLNSVFRNNDGPGVGGVGDRVQRQLPGVRADRRGLLRCQSSVSADGCGCGAKHPSRWCSTRTP